MGEGAYNGTRLDISPCSQGEPFEADHGVATPVCEPMVTGYDAMTMSYPVACARAASSLRPAGLMTN